MFKVDSHLIRNVVIVVLLVFLFQDYFFDNYLCIEKLSPPVHSSPKIKTSVEVFSASPSYSYDGQCSPASLVGGPAVYYSDPCFLRKRES